MSKHSIVHMHYATCTRNYRNYKQSHFWPCISSDRTIVARSNHSSGEGKWNQKGFVCLEFFHWQKKDRKTEADRHKEINKEKCWNEEEQRCLCFGDPTTGVRGKNSESIMWSISICLSEPVNIKRSWSAQCKTWGCGRSLMLLKAPTLPL